MIMPHVVLQNASLAVCAGHSDTDPGAMANGYTEAEIVLPFRQAVAFCLKQRGLKFETDGEHQENQPLPEAVKVAERNDVAVEFHCNAVASPQASGCEVLSLPDNMELGGRLSRAVAKTLGITDRGAKPDDAGAHSRLAFARAGGLVVELFFLTNPQDLERFLDHRMAVAEEVAKVLLDEVCSHAYWS